MIVHRSTLQHRRGHRRAHVFPPLEIVQHQMRKALVEAEHKKCSTVMGFDNIFSDDFLVYVDLNFSPLEANTGQAASEVECKEMAQCTASTLTSKRGANQQAAILARRRRIAVKQSGGAVKGGPEEAIVVAAKTRCSKSTRTLDKFAS